MKAVRDSGGDPLWSPPQITLGRLFLLTTYFGVACGLTYWLEWDFGLALIVVGSLWLMVRIGRLIAGCLRDESATPSADSATADPPYPTDT